ncbi:centaurin/arf, putative [Perkinsus marinus ATCC 50983]|uniref:Centaurin/arf, putative n=1 Tax=Perkinsus marinus (strain ATCC 50983 / TXsc) TaxID=423536 RepID=C5L2H7_PERM5|nr:centaurin/arf, putative [Perkinsus marinus ATCC 50983]EER09071.1 centaurin/arf, putative [Perkinsus marinus ATCC 50983]|eukprot:XP_002777255.1 centaurin/arf, putative [Perkinsus marinus ATCC 50983]
MSSSSAEPHRASCLPELDDLLARPGNRHCADCGRDSPHWASVNLGVFLCRDCSSIHNRLGVNVSIVQSLVLDSWQNTWILIMTHVGNNIANSYYEQNLPESFRKPKLEDGIRAVERFIWTKYVGLQFAPNGRPPPPSGLAARGERTDIYLQQAGMSSLSASPVIEEPRRGGRRAKAHSREKKRLVQKLEKVSKAANAHMDIRSPPYGLAVRASGLSVVEQVAKVMAPEYENFGPMRDASIFDLWSYEMRPNS